MLKEGAGALIQEARERQDLAQQDLATETGLSIWTISNIETGRNRSPRRRTVFQIAKRLRLDPADLLDDPVALREAS